MNESQKAKLSRIIVTNLAWTVLSGLMFSISVGYATQRYVPAFLTGMAMGSVIDVFYVLDQAFLQPQLERIPHPGFRFSLPIAFSLLEHVGGAALALYLCSRAFDFSLRDLRTWWPVLGMVLAFPIIHGTETALGFYRQLKQKEKVEQELRTLATQAELKALKAQINPHFLFNTLNTIAALIHTDPAQAEMVVERLAEMFRYTLIGSERAAVPLAEEIAFVDHYLEIERARFGQRLHITREIAPGTLAVPVPSLILQPLVENAIRHGQAPDGQIDLGISVTRYADEVWISIADRGPGIPAGYDVTHKAGHGLHNVNERLLKTYERGLEIGANEPQGTVVTVRVPFFSPLPATTLDVKTDEE